MADTPIAVTSTALTVATPTTLSAAEVGVTKADLQPSGQELTLTWVNPWTIAVDKADIQPTGQSIAFDSSVAVTNADFQPDGQDSTFDISFVIAAAGFQADGQDLTLSPTTNLSLEVDTSAFSLSGSAVDLTLTTSATGRVYSGGWVESAYQKRYAELNDQIRRELEEEQEREELAERLERVLVKEGTLTQAQADLIRLRGLADKYNRDDLPNRARRALAFAERAKSELSAKLALREIRRVEEEDEYAILLLLAMD